jgi:CAAX prenyl protease-like protein
MAVTRPLFAKRGRVTPFLSTILPRVAPFAAFIVLLALQPVLAGIVDERWLVVSRGLAAAALLAILWRRYRELFEVPATAAREWVVAVGAGFLVAVLWIALDAPWAHMGEPSTGFVPLDRGGGLDPLLVALRLFGFVLVVPVMEELFWRSFLMRRIDRTDFLALDPRATTLAALALSAAVFALAHSAWFAGLVAGAVYGTIYRRTGNLRACVASHATSNLTIGGWTLATRDWSLW